MDDKPNDKTTIEPDVTQNPQRTCHEHVLIYFGLTPGTVEYEEYDRQLTWMSQRNPCLYHKIIHLD